MSVGRSIVKAARARRPELPDVGTPIVAGIDVSPSAKTTLIFLDETGRPAIVAKVARDPAAEPDLEREYDALRIVRAAADSPFVEQLPEPLALARVEGLLALIATGVVGESMMTRYYRTGHTADPANVARDLSTAYAWLSDFQRQTTTGQLSLAEAASRWTEQVLPRYRAELGSSAEEDSLFADVAARAHELADVVVPVTAVHGDFWVGNLLVGDGRVVGVVDWERAAPAGPPLADIYKFPTSYGFYMDRVRSRRARRSSDTSRDELRLRWSRYGSWPNLIGFAHTYFGRGWFPDLVRGAILDQLARLGVPPAANGVFFPIFLAEQALALPDQSFRSGYRSAIRAFSIERDSTWLWRDDVEREPSRELLAAPGGAIEHRSEHSSHA